jgi:Dolichyl-phosphate-mannose-protein mannosyltransferase
VAGSRRSSGALAAICVFVLAVGAWNIVRYPPGKGYDALEHMAYADGLVPGWKLPQGTGEYYTPPGYYAVAGSLDWVAGKAGVGDPHRGGMAVNVLFLLGTVLVVWRLARDVVPSRERVAVGAAAFVALVPVDVRSAAMFQPGMAALFFCTLALWLSVRTLADRRYAIALGAALGVAQLVLAASLLTVVAVAAALTLGRRWRALAVTITLAVVIPLPWYVHQQTTYSGLAPFPRPPTPQARSGGTETGKPKPIYSRRPARFYVDPGIPDVVTHPYRPHFLNLLLPTTYAELWGDWEGHWAWRGVGSPSKDDRRTLQLQSVVGLLPTVLAVFGWLALLAASLRSPPRLAVALLPGLGLLGYLYFTVGYPTSDGDVLKAWYMLTTAGAWALAFGFALDRLRSPTVYLVVGLLALGAVAELPFLVY